MQKNQVDQNSIESLLSKEECPIVLCMLFHNCSKKKIYMLFRKKMDEE